MVGCTVGSVKSLKRSSIRISFYILLPCCVQKNTDIQAHASTHWNDAYPSRLTVQGLEGLGC